MSLLLRRRMLLNEIITGGLPSSYQRVDYIESTGKQIIDTGFKPTNNTRLELDIKFSERLTPPNGNYFLGVYDASGTFSVNFGGGVGQENDLYVWINERTALGGTYTVGAFDDLTFISRNSFILTNEELTYGNKTLHLTKGKWSEMEYSLRIFGFLNASQIERPFDRANMFLYAFKIYDNGILARDFIPCYRKADGVIGLYDLVYGKFYTNAGTGTFLKGADI